MTSVFRVLSSAVLGFASLAPLASALAETPAMTVEGEGHATKKGTGGFTTTLPDGSECSASFSGGKISLLGQSAAKGVGTCSIGEEVRPVRVVVFRRLNGLPREATLTFNDGTRVTVVIPRDAATGTTTPGDPASATQTDLEPPPLPDLDLEDPLEQPQ